MMNLSTAAADAEEGQTTPTDKTFPNKAKSGAFQYMNQITFLIFSAMIKDLNHHREKPNIWCVKSCSDGAAPPLTLLAADVLSLVGPEPSSLSPNMNNE